MKINKYRNTRKRYQYIELVFKDDPKVYLIEAESFQFCGDRVYFYTRDKAMWFDMDDLVTGRFIGRSHRLGATIFGCVVGVASAIVVGSWLSSNIPVVADFIGVDDESTLGKAAVIGIGAIGAGGIGMWVEGEVCDATEDIIDVYSDFFNMIKEEENDNTED